MDKIAPRASQRVQDEPLRGVLASISCRLNVSKSIPLRSTCKRENNDRLDSIDLHKFISEDLKGK